MTGAQALFYSDSIHQFTEFMYLLLQRTTINNLNGSTYTHTLGNRGHWQIGGFTNRKKGKGCLKINKYTLIRDVLDVVVIAVKIGVIFCYATNVDGVLYISAIFTITVFCWRISKGGIL